jgi:hypothetical protein
MRVSADEYEMNIGGFARDGRALAASLGARWRGTAGALAVASSTLALLARALRPAAIFP